MPKSIAGSAWQLLKYQVNKTNVTRERPNCHFNNPRAWKNYDKETISAQVRWNGDC